MKKVEKSDEKTEAGENVEKKEIFEIVPVEDISKMTIEEAVERGLLPTPIELAKTTEEVIEYGKQMGTMYGGALASIYSAFTRRDLPFNVRLAKGMRGASFLLGVILSTIDTFENIRNIEDHVLLKKGKLVRPKDVVDELIQELEKLRQENAELKKKIPDKSKNKE